MDAETNTEGKGYTLWDIGLRCAVNNEGTEYAHHIDAAHRKFLSFCSGCHKDFNSPLPPGEEGKDNNRAGEESDDRNTTGEEGKDNRAVKGQRTSEQVKREQRVIKHV